MREVGERREEENGRRGYGKRAGTSCEVRAARHEIASFAIDRVKKGPSSVRVEGLSSSSSIAVARPAEKPIGERTGAAVVAVADHRSVRFAV